MNKQKVGIVPKIFMGLGMAIIIGLGIFYFYDSGDGELMFFTQHFFLPIILALIGIIVIFMSVVSQRSLAGDDKGDKMMFGVGLILILCSLITLITSFI